jgi:hypothetical protein
MQEIVLTESTPGLGPILQRARSNKLGKKWLKALSAMLSGVHIWVWNIPEKRSHHLPDKFMPPKGSVVFVLVRPESLAPRAFNAVSEQCGLIVRESLRGGVQLLVVEAETVSVDKLRLVLEVLQRGTAK